MATSTGPTSKLCRWVCSIRYEDLPAVVRKQTATLFFDMVGSMVASATLPSCQPIVGLIRTLGLLGGCSIVGHPLRSSVTNAALANGTIAHGDEADPVGYHSSGGHFPAVVIPAALSVGQYMGTSGKELYRAIALGSESAARIQNILWQHSGGSKNPFVRIQGGTLGGAISAGLLLGLDAQQMEHALGLAASGICGLYSHHVDGFHQTKSLTYGRAAEAGVLSALLAREGSHGPTEILTIENGLFDAYLGERNAGHEVVQGLGEQYLMLQIMYKRYSVGLPCQTPLYSFLQLLKTQKIAADDIEEIEVSVGRNAFHTVTTNRHATVHLPTILCLAAVYGEVTFAHVHDSRYVEDPRIKAFRDRTRILIIPRTGPATKGRKSEMGMTVRTRNGKTLSRELDFQSMSEVDIQHKFRYLVGRRLDSARVASLESKLNAIETEQNVASLIGELELAY